MLEDTSDKKKKIEQSNYLHPSLAIQNAEFSPNDAF